MMSSEMMQDPQEELLPAPEDGPGLPGGEPAPGDSWRQELAEELIGRARSEGVQLTGPGGLLTGITQLVLETALETELTDHLGYDKGDRAGRGSPNMRNGHSAKTVHTDAGPVRIAVPRDRAGSFEPLVVPKHARRVGGFDAAILSLYAKGLTTGEIQAHLAEVYGAEVSRELISKVTDAVNDELAAWRNRPLDRVYPVLFAGRDHGQDPGRGGGEPAGVYRARRVAGRGARCAGDVGRDRRGGRQAVARLPRRAEEPGRGRRVHRLHRRAQGPERGDRGGLARRHPPDLRGPPGPAHATAHQP